MQNFVSRFAGDTAGNIAMLLGILVVAAAGGAGIALDFGRAYSVKSDLQSAADAAVLAVMPGSMPAGQAKQYVQKTFEENATAQHGLELTNVNPHVDDSGTELTATAVVPSVFGKLFGIDDYTVNVRAKSTAAVGKLEIALVLDNTGSMRNDMDALRTAAKELVEEVFQAAGGASSVKVGVVPYVGAVNIGNGSEQMAWMDTAALSVHHADHLEGRWIAYEPGCSYTPGGGGGDGPGDGTGGDDRQSSLQSRPTRFAAVLRAVLGISSANAAVPPPYTQDDCFMANPADINHFDLFDRIGNASWKGCVEARPAPHDVTDTPPDMMDPDTLFVPYLWPDEPDIGTYPNNYMADKPENLPAPYEFTWPGDTSGEWEYGRYRTVTKYDGTNANIVETGPDTLGPNASCPDALLPLSEDEDEIIEMIDNLSHWEGSGTVSSQGLVWGWRVLSPTEPFTEGEAYGDAKKIIVLMTDGENMAAEQSSTVWSDYTSYGYVNHAHEPEMETYVGFQDTVNAKLLQACANAKAEGIEIYTVTFGNLDAATNDVYTQCATMPPMHYEAAGTEALIEAFQDIAYGISQLRLSE